MFWLASLLIPGLLVFGLFHLLTWLNVRNLNSLTFRKRVSVTSALSHIILAVGFFAFSYADYLINQRTTLAGVGFDGYLFNQSPFWRLAQIFDTAPMLALLGVVYLLDKLGIDLPIMVALAFVIMLSVGTIQWYIVGGGIGLLLERFWSGLKTADDEDEDWL